MEKEKIVKSVSIFKPRTKDGVPEISPEELKNHLDQVTLIDVRNPDEFNGELSHIPGAKLVTLGPALDVFLNSHSKDDTIVFICRSGGRSGRATLQGQTMGFLKCVNLEGGMILWNQRKYPTEKQK